MNVSVLVPWTPGCPYRASAWAHVQRRYAAAFPNWQIITGHGDTPDGYSRTRAILDAESRCNGDVLVIADADVWCNPGLAVLGAVENGWAIPHTLIHRLSPESTHAVLVGADWHGLPLSTDNKQDSKPYVGHECGTLLVIRRDVFHQAPPDPRFVGWGQEDRAWSIALRTLVGEPQRGDDDLVHLWHPAQPRKTRTTGSEANAALLRRYQLARRRPEQMRALITEARLQEVV